MRNILNQIVTKFNTGFTLLKDFDVMLWFVKAFPSETKCQTVSLITPCLSL